ncbi:hypothetical protein J5X84_15625 [Streptosporangiaceae bacterium NEAU-GS5]|nr:hypothetical protein [Streptosporangiaceae bacterium NEAU-GS5]
MTAGIDASMGNALDTRGPWRSPAEVESAQRTRWNHHSRHPEQLSLRKAGAEHEAAEIAERALIHAVLNPNDVAWLIESLREAGAWDRANALAECAVFHAVSRGPFVVGWLMDGLREAEIGDQLIVLIERAAADVALDDLWAVDRSVSSLREADAEHQATALVRRRLGW